MTTPIPGDERLSLADRWSFFTTKVWSYLRPCPTCQRRPRRWPMTPRWDQDRTARMLGLPVEGHCPDCGKGKR